MRAGARVTGVVLAGGAGRRMGGDKAALRFGGEPLAIRVVRRIAPACTRIVIAGGMSRRPLSAATTVADPLPHAGPLGGIVAGLQAAGGVCVVVAVDLPFANAGVLRLLLDRWRGEDAVVPLVGGRLQPLHALYGPAALQPLVGRLHAGERSVTRALAGLTVRRVTPAEWTAVDPRGSFSLNLNRPADLAGLSLLHEQR